jgi:hypothetical protein
LLLGESDSRYDGEGFVIPEGMEELIDIERHNWKRHARQNLEAGVPTASSQGFRSLFANNQEAPITNSTQVAAAADTILWDPAGIAPQTAIPANTLKADDILKVTAWGVNTTAVTGSQTVAFTPRFGTTVSGTSLGVSRTMPVNAAVVTTQPFYCELYFHCRLVGSAGTATAGGWISTQSVIGTAATTNTSPANFGTSSTTATTINTTTASGLLVSVNASLNTNTWQTLGVVMESLN